MDISEDHQTRKRESYWSNLVAGETGIYKAEAIDRLVRRWMPTRCDAVLDIGCGTSAIAMALRNQMKAARLVFMDYDAGVIDTMRRDVGDDSVEYKVADIFALEHCDDRFDLVLLLDMIHEVYSFYGRPVRRMDCEIDHDTGQRAVREALRQVAQLVKPGGGIVITDNVLPQRDGPLTVHIRTAAASLAVRRFLTDYPSRRIGVTWRDERTLDIGAFDFTILLTQYNKIKASQEDRWNVEKFEIHQYMTVEEFRAMFHALGFTLHALVGTPKGAAEEWREDFQVLEGTTALPDKRISLIAVKPA